MFLAANNLKPNMSSAVISVKNYFKRGILYQKDNNVKSFSEYVWRDNPDGFLDDLSLAPVIINHPGTTLV